jgi:fluoride exporter
MPSLAINMLIVSLAGSLGCVLRAIARDILVRARVEAWKAILAINLAGGAACGVVLALRPESGSRASLVALSVLAGWTTYSAFSVDVVLLWHAGRRAAATICWAATLLGAPLLALGAHAATLALKGGDAP